MAVTKYDASVFIYHAAVVLSGAWIIENFGLRGTGALYGVAVVVGLLWTLYFRWSFVERLPAEYGNRPATEE